MNRLDYYDILPEGMEAYLSAHGHHISKPMLAWAVNMMRDRNGKRVPVPESKQVEDLMKAYGVELDRKDGHYDSCYVYAMATSDYLGSSIKDEGHLVLYVKDYIDDRDGNPTRAFDELFANCVAKGVDIPWPDLI